MDHENLRAHDSLSSDSSQPDRPVASSTEPSEVIQGVLDATFP